MPASSSSSSVTATSGLLTGKTLIILTDPNLPELTPSDQLALSALKDAGASVSLFTWSHWDEDPQLSALKSADAVIIRTCWDYQFHQDSFQAFMGACAQQRIRLWNPPGLVQWNLDKRYLKALAAAGVPIVPTVWLEAADLTTQDDLPGQIRQRLREQGWTQAVIKPIVSASGTFTTRFKPDVAEAEMDATLKALWPQAQESGLMLQPFLSQVCDEGEWTFVYFAAATAHEGFSHAVLKKPESGEFRVQTHFGGQNHAVAQVDAALRAQADKVMAGLAVCRSERWLYARVDGVVVDGQLQLMELEVIEPHLFFECDEVSAGRYVQAVARILQR